MVSEYEYATIAEVEAFMNIDFGALVDPIIDGNVEADISQAERTINVKTNTTFTSPFPDAVKTVVLELSSNILYNRMVWMGLMDRENPKKIEKPTWEESWDKLLEPFMNVYSLDRTIWWE